MPVLSVVEESNTKYAPSYIPTAVFVGGTSGIGRAMAEAFAAQTKGHANIILIGRNKAPADEIIAGFPTVPSDLGSTVKHEFVQCDASEMKNVYNTCQELLSRIDKINILVLSVGGVAFRRKNTAEGLDTSMVLRYYCRAKFITQLLPLLSKARTAGEDARVLSILAAAKGRAVDLEDPGLQNWSSSRAMVTTGTYNDIMIKALSDQHPELAFAHIYPGLVDTPGARNINWFFNLLVTLLKPFVVVTPQVCAQFMLYPLLNPDFSTGGYWLDNNAEILSLPGNLTEEVVQKIWHHTLEVIKPN